MRWDGGNRYENGTEKCVLCTNMVYTLDYNGAKYGPSAANAKLVAGKILSTSAVSAWSKGYFLGAGVTVLK